MDGDFESLLFGLLFLAVVGFQVFKQFLAARAEQRRRQQQALQARAGGQADMPQPETDPFALTESDWGRAPEPVVPAPVPGASAPAPSTSATVPLEVQQALRQAAARARDAAPAAAVRRTSAEQQRRRARHRLFHSQRALRHGIVMMTVLGPCRAEQPYDRDI